MGIAKGVCLGPYEIVSHLGSGGMGDVWRAHDHRIRRDVAVKVLSQAFMAGDEGLERFEVEARAAGALNHPGLVTIFDVGRTAEGKPYIVMELLEGQTLREVIGDPNPTPLPLWRAMDYAIQIASALAVAHANGIMHRDLKPENLFVTSDRRVKILDFGLAKLASASTDDQSRRRTSRHLTSAGIVVGTPSYMSPEQVRAAPLDQRTDIFSLGSVLYEMITGRPAFERSSAIETMHAVLTDEPAPFDLPNISPALEDTVRHCLEKAPGERFQSANDLAFHLRTLPETQRRTSDSRKVVPIGKGSRYRAALIVLPLLLAVTAGGVAMRRYREGAAPATLRTYRQLTSAEGMETFPTLAPDGKSFAYVSSQAGNRDIYVQRVDGRVSLNITADSPDDDTEPAFSPDGSKIAFRSEREGGGIYVMGASGDSPLRLTDFGHNPAWSPDGTQLVFATEEVELIPIRGPNSELWIVDVRSGARRPLVQKGKGGADFGRDSDSVQPSWSPHGKRIAFWGTSSVSDQYDIWTIDPTAPEPKKTAVRVTSDTALHWSPVWSADGTYLYYGSDRDGTMNLWRVAMDEDSGTPRGVPEPVALPAAFAGNFDFARSGELAYVAVASSYRVLAIPFDADAATIGPPRHFLGGSQEILSFHPSPDGKTIAYTVDTGTQEDIFVASVDGMRIRQLTNDPAIDRAIHFTPDGKALYFSSNRDGKAYRIWSIRADGSGVTSVTSDHDVKSIGARNLFQPVISPDGRTLIAQTDRDTSVLVHLDRPPGRRVEPLPVFLPTPRWSPDGQFIVARNRRPRTAKRGKSDDFPGAIVLYSLQTGRAEKLSDSGVSPHWTPDGKKVVYFEPRDIRILDLASRALKIVPYAPVAGGQVDLRGCRLSRDAKTLYMRQTVQQGDIWMARLSTE